MNKRIRELVRQAVESVDIVTGNESLDDELAKMYIPAEFTKKLAELIVRECARVYWNIDDGEIHGEYVKALKEHFGVEK
jgi:hypothetical protein